MRVTLHLDSFDRVDPAGYAIVWLDNETGKWSREGHAGLTLPEWGCYRCADGATYLLSADGASEICMLEGLDLAQRAGPFEGEDGAAVWRAGAGETSGAGRWHVQWVDATQAHPEESLFADA